VKCTLCGSWEIIALVQQKSPGGKLSMRVTREKFMEIANQHFSEELGQMSDIYVKGEEIFDAPDPSGRRVRLSCAPYPC